MIILFLALITIFLFLLTVVGVYGSEAAAKLIRKAAALALLLIFGGIVLGLIGIAWVVLQSIPEKTIATVSQIVWLALAGIFWGALLWACLVSSVPSLSNVEAKLPAVMRSPLTGKGLAIWVGIGVAVLTPIALLLGFTGH